MDVIGVLRKGGSAPGAVIGTAAKTGHSDRDPRKDCCAPLAAEVRVSFPADGCRSFRNAARGRDTSSGRRVMTAYAPACAADLRLA